MFEVPGRERPSVFAALAEAAPVPRRLYSLCLLVCGLILATPARAAEPELSRVKPITLSLELGVALTLTGAALLIPAPSECRWCSPPGFDESLASPVAPRHRAAAGAVSHLLSASVLPSLAVSALILPPLTTSEHDAHALENVAIAGEAVLAELTLSQLVKKAVARKRPAFFYGRQASTEYADSPGHENVSFFSGDAGAAFAIASSMTTLSYMRGYASAPYVAIAGAAFASATACLRVAADVHWASDVATGALLGTGIGVALPLLLHPRVEESGATSDRSLLLPSLTSSSAMLQFNGVF